MMGFGVIVAKLMVAGFCAERPLEEEKPAPGVELWLHPMNRRGPIRQSDEKSLMYSTCFEGLVRYRRLLRLLSSREKQEIGSSRLLSVFT
jgi:hypothetical protein